MKFKLLFILLLCTSCSASNDVVDITGTWQIAAMTNRGEVADISEAVNFSAVIDETTWVDNEGARTTTYYYYAKLVNGQTQVKVCADKECKDIEALMIVRKKDDLLEFSMIDYSEGDEYPTVFESTKDNDYKLFKLKRKKE